MFLLVLYCVIFGFSAQDGETSGGISLKVSRFGVELWNDLTDRNWSERIKAQLAAYFEHPLRKLAHFSEYALMGFVVRSIFVCWEKYNRGWLALTVLWVCLAAAVDEFHQLFVPGRCGSLADVLLDTCGGLFGALLCMILCRIILRKRHP